MSDTKLNSLLRPPFRWWIKRGSGMVFDWVHQVDTGFGAAKNLEITSTNQDKGVPYDPCPWPTLRQALRLVSLPVGGFTFVDIGCGKGKVLLSAAALPFERVIGVEYSSYLSRVAERNLASARLFRRRCPSVEVICADAVRYPIPQEPAVFFFHNPFKYEVMEVVLGNIAGSYLQSPRRIFLIFVAASSLIPQIREFLPGQTADRARLRVSGVLGKRSINIFELPEQQQQPNRMST